jgi:inorganic pyrophosphatase
MRIDAIAIGTNPPHDVNVIIEVPVGGQPIKYEMDKEAGTLVVDRFLYTPMTYPGNYGFVPHTLSEDGDPIDVLVCNTRQLVPGCLINVRPIGVLVMEDNAGRDEKIIAVPSPHLTRRYENVTEYSDLPGITLEQIEHFFEHYKDLEPGKCCRGAPDDRRGDRAGQDGKVETTTPKRQASATRPVSARISGSTTRKHAPRSRPGTSSSLPFMRVMISRLIGRPRPAPPLALSLSLPR